MTIQEKSELLMKYCRSLNDCGKCVLNSKNYNWKKSLNCLCINCSPESDLDKALELINYKVITTDTTDKIILTTEQKKVCTDVLAFYGYDMERMVAIEEMSELTKELSKQKRGEGNRDHLIEEIADVYLCLEKIEQMNNITHEELSDWIARKTDVIKTRIKSEGKIEP